MGVSKKTVFITLASLILLAVFAKALQFVGFRVHDWDTGIYANVAWNIIEGDGYYSDVLRKHHLGEHFSPITIVFAPLFLIWPSAFWLVAAQGLAVGSTCTVIYLYARKEFEEKLPQDATLVALLFAAWLLFYPPLTSALLFQFHPTTLVLPFVAGALLALQRHKTGLLWVCVVVIFLSKENGALVMLGLAVYASLIQKRHHLGLLLIVAAVASAVISMGLVMPAFRDISWGHTDRIGPFDFLGRKALYLFALFGGLLFLPLLAWRFSLCALALILLNLSVKYSPQFTMSFQYDDFISIFLIVAAIHGFPAALDHVQALLKNRWSVQAGTIAITAVTAASIFGIGMFLHDIAMSWPQPKHMQLHRELAKIRAYPNSVGISADGRLGPYVSSRTRYIPFRFEQMPQMLDRLNKSDLILVTPIGRAHIFSIINKYMDLKDNWKIIHDTEVLRIYAAK